MTYFKAEPKIVKMGDPQVAEEEEDLKSLKYRESSESYPTQEKENEQYKILKFGPPRKKDNRSCGLVSFTESAPVKGPKLGASGIQRLAVADPWAAAVFRGDEIICSATIISERWIITASKCLLNATTEQILDLNDFSIGYGSPNLTATHRVAIERAVFHENRKGRITGNDFALVKIKGTLDLLAMEDDGFVNNAICLPRNKAVLSKVKTYAWGFRTANKGRAKPILLVETKMKIATDAECGTLYTSKLFSGGIIPVNPPEDIVCAYAESTEGCAADRGAALVHVVKGRSILAGVSFQMGCSIEDRMIAGIYVNIHSHRSWINHVINETS